jgi:hypothetical protein
MPALSFNKNLRRNIILAIFILSLFLGYSYFVKAVKHEHYQIFNVKTTITWAQSERSLYRTHAYGTVDNMLLSQDQWREYVFSLRVTNPENCGLVFDYSDNQNYGFFYFKRTPGEVVGGQLIDGKLQNVKAIRYTVPGSFQTVLKKEKSAVDLFVEGQLLMSVPSREESGKVGLIINTLAKPPTVYHEITIDGSLGSREKVLAQVNTPVTGGALNAFWKFLPAYLILMIVLVFFPSVAPGATITILFESATLKKFLPLFLHVVLAACLFWPFISAGQVAIFSYDNLGEIFPLFYYAKHNFANILHGQSPWLWNPVIQNGFPFYSNHWNMIYYPLNWPVFLVSDQDFLKAVTFKSFVEVSLLGIFAYGFFKRELGNSRWALFSSVAYQMCSLLIFTMSIFPATSLFFSMTVYLYLLWSVPERRSLANFLLLSISVVLILTSANVAFIFYACLSLGIISIYRFFSVKDGKKLFLLTAAGWSTGTLISSVSILSCLQGVTHGNRLLENFYTLHDRAYMAVRLFVPEIAGWMGPDAFNVLKSPNLQLIFSQLELPSSNPQNCFFVYFGVLPALLLLASLLITTKGRHAFWKIYAFIALGIALLLQPLWGILSVLSFPLSHYSYHAIILPVGICTLIGYTGMAWESGLTENKNFQRNILLCLVVVVAYVMVFVTYLFPQLAPVTRVVFLVLGAGMVLYFTKFFSWAVGALNVLSLTLLIVLTVLMVLSPIPKKEALATTMMLPFLWITAAVLLILDGHHRNQQGRSFKTILLPLGLAIVIALGFVLSGMVDRVLSWEEGVRVYALDVFFGGVRVLLLVQIGLLAFSGIQKKMFSVRVIFAVVLALTALDLVVFNARFNNITSPFYFKNAFYPKDFIYRDMAPTLRQSIDLNNYRVSHLERKDFNANKNLIFNLPSYTGTVGYMTPRFSRFLTAFGFTKGIYMLYPEDSTDNPRFLDLSAVKYSFDEQGGVIERPSALARLNVIYSTQVIVDDEETLARLQSPQFDPRKTVLLSQAITDGLPAVGQDALMIPIGENAPDRIVAKVNTPAAGILLFAESFDEGWKLFIDDKPVAILRANYNFMAGVIGAGEHEIRFVYAPPQYRRNVLLTALGLLIFAAAAVMLLVSLLSQTKRA